MHFVITCGNFYLKKMLIIRNNMAFRCAFPLPGPYFWMPQAITTSSTFSK